MASSSNINSSIRDLAISDLRERFFSSSKVAASVCLLETYAGHIHEYHSFCRPLFNLVHCLKLAGVNQICVNVKDGV